MEQLTQTLLDAVTANLPQMVGAQLRERLTKADEDAKLAATLPKLNEELVEAKKRQSLLDSERAAVAVERAELAKLKAEVEQMKIKLAAESKTATDSMAFARFTLETVFRDRQVFHIQANGSLPIPSGSGYTTQGDFSVAGSVKSAT